MVPIRLVRQIGSLCEFMFRWGVKDSATLCDPVVSNEFANQDDAYDNLCFLISNYGIVKPAIYIDILYLKTRIEIRLNELSNFLGRSKMDVAIKNGLCYICNFYYRKGVAYGVGVDKRDALIMYDKINSGRSHPYLYGGRLSHNKFILCVKSECAIIDALRSQHGLTRRMTPLINLMAKVIKNENRRKEVLGISETIRRYESELDMEENLYIGADEDADTY